MEKQEQEAGGSSKALTGEEIRSSRQKLERGAGQVEADANHQGETTAEQPDDSDEDEEEENVENRSERVGLNSLHEDFTRTLITTRRTQWCAEVPPFESL